MITVHIPTGTPDGDYTIATPQPTPTTQLQAGDIGVDLSQYNAVTDFGAIKASGKRVVIHRATKGATGMDSQYSSRWPLIQAARFDFSGIYHLFIPGVNGLDQWKNLANIPITGETYPVTVDVEPIPSGATYTDPANQVVGPLRALLEEIRKAALCMPIVYTSYNAVSVMGLRNQSWLLDYPLHFAQYGPADSLVPDPWKSAGKGYIAWQFNNKGVVPGVTGDVDLDKFSGQPFVLA